MGKRVEEFFAGVVVRAEGQSIHGDSIVGRNKHGVSALRRMCQKNKLVQNQTHMAQCVENTYCALRVGKIDKMAYNLCLSTIEVGVFAIFKTNTLVTIINRN